MKNTKLGVSGYKSMVQINGARACKWTEENCKMKNLIIYTIIRYYVIT